MPRQLVARPVLRAGEADRRQCGERDEREHERLEPVAPELHRLHRNLVDAAQPEEGRDDQVPPEREHKAPAVTATRARDAGPPRRRAVQSREDDADRCATRRRVVDVHRPREPHDIQKDVHEQERRPGRRDTRRRSRTSAPAPAASAGSVTVRTISHAPWSKGHHDQIPCSGSTHPRSCPTSCVGSLIQSLTIEPPRRSNGPHVATANATRAASGGRRARVRRRPRARRARSSRGSAIARAKRIADKTSRAAARGVEGEHRKRCEGEREWLGQIAEDRHDEPREEAVEERRPRREAALDEPQRHRGRCRRALPRRLTTSSAYGSAATEPPLAARATAG